MYPLEGNKKMTLSNKKLLGLVLTTALTSVAFQAKADNAWSDLQGTGFTTDISVDKVTDITTSVMVAVGLSPTNLNIDFDETVNVNTISADAVFVASQVSDDNLATFISGSLNSNGKIVIQDTNGIIYRDGATIDVNGLVSTTAGTVNVSADGKTIELNDFGSVGSVIVQSGAEITITEGGLAAFVAPTVVNNGLIKAVAGRIELAGANTKTTVDLYGDGLLEIEVNETNSAALLARNSGELKAAGGVIHMTTGAAEALVNSTVNLDGLARVSSATQVGGKIILGGSNTKLVRVANKAQATGATKGGEIQMTGEEVNVLNDAVINVSATDNGDGGTINLLASNKAILNGSFRAKGGDNGGNGGVITTSAVNELSFGSGSLTVDAQAFNGGESGSWVIDPINLDINTKEAGIFNNTLNTGTSIDASATNGVTLNGDVVWTSGADFALTAGNNLVLNNVINGGGAFAGSAGGDVVLASGSSVSVIGANIVLTSGNDILVNNGSELSITNGDMTLTATNANGGLSAIEVDGSIVGDNANINMDSTDYFTEINTAASITQVNGGTFAISSNHGFDIDAGAILNLGSASVDVQAPDVRLGADINTTGSITGNATLVAVENNTAQIQDGVDVAKSGNATMVNIAAGTYNESVTIEKALILSGAGRDATTISAGLTNNGVTIDGDIGNFGRVYIRNLGFDGNLNGVEVKSTVNANEVLIGGSKFTNNADTGVVIRDGATTGGLNKFTMGYSEFANNGQKGVAVYGDTTTTSSIYNTDFLNNGLNSTSRGEGDILFYFYNGDVSLRDIDVQGNTGGLADYGIQIIGAPSFAQSGVIELDNVSVSGQYRAANLGIQEYDGIQSLTMMDVSLGGRQIWVILHLDGVVEYSSVI